MLLHNYAPIISLKLAQWNTNGKSVKKFKRRHKMIIILSSEARFNNRSYIRFPKYDIYGTKPPDRTGHNGTAIIIKTNIKHLVFQTYDHCYFQETSIIVGG